MIILISPCFFLWKNVTFDIFHRIFCQTGSLLFKFYYLPLDFSCRDILFLCLLFLLLNAPCSLCLVQSFIRRNLALNFLASAVHEPSYLGCSILEPPLLSEMWLSLHFTYDSFRQIYR